MVSWGFLTNHARVLLCIARDPGVRLRDIASSLGITERSGAAPVAFPLHDWGRRSGFCGGHVAIVPRISQSAPA